MMDQRPLPALTPGSIDPSFMDEKATTYARAARDRFNVALAASDAEALESCFYADAYWKDQLALTWHLRTFRGPGTIAASLLETARLRGLPSGISIDGEAVFLPATPVPQSIDGPLVFRTESPAGLCRGKMLLLPVIEDRANINWKIWIMSTRLENLDLQAEDEQLLRAPARPLQDLVDFKTDVFIIGAIMHLDNSAIALSPRLKALGVESVMADRNARLGDNWALRYDCMQFHVPTAFCDLPYMAYDDNLRSPHRLTRQDLVSQVRRYVDSFNLNTLHSVEVHWIEYDELAKKWFITLQTPTGQRKATSKHLVLATGIRSQKPNMPHIAEPHQYKGVSIHSTEYRNAKLLRESVVKSVIVIGSAYTTFDVLEDCHNAGLDAAMVARSPTYIVPLEHICHESSLGIYDSSVDAADNLFCSLPTVVEGQFGRGLFAMLASAEPERYAALKAAGFPVPDSREPTCALIHNFLERAGGQYIDVGGTMLIEEGKVGIKAGVEPVSYTETGLQFSDSTCLDADAIIWCTGFADLNVVTAATEILSGETDGQTERVHVLTPRDIASRLDATWGVDEEGEIRGMWKRHSHAESIWVWGGSTQQHRWHSRTIALQIKAALEGILPPAYGNGPTPKE
ncbi:monooxygenase [Aspergillus similis]